MLFGELMDFALGKGQNDSLCREFRRFVRHNFSLNPCFLRRLPSLEQFSRSRKIDQIRISLVRGKRNLACDEVKQIFASLFFLSVHNQECPSQAHGQRLPCLRDKQEHESGNRSNDVPLRSKSRRFCAPGQDALRIVLRIGSRHPKNFFWWFAVERLQTAPSITG